MPAIQEELFDTRPPKAKPETYRELAERARLEGCPKMAELLERTAEIAEQRRRTK